MKKKVMKKCVHNLLTVISFGAIHKGCLHIRGEGGGGSCKSGKMLTGGVGWLAKGGRLLGQKIIATIFVKLTQIIWQCVCI